MRIRLRFFREHYSQNKPRALCSLMLCVQVKAKPPGTRGFCGNIMLMSGFVRIERWFIYLFFLVLPFQTRIIFGRWLPLPLGWLPTRALPFLEWTSGFIYISDFVIFILIAFGFVHFFKNRPTIRLKSFDYALIIFLLIAFLSIFYALVPKIALYRSLKLLEYSALYYYFRWRGLQLLTINRLWPVILVGGGFQAVIAIFQSLLQKSLGLRFLLESPLAITQNNIAVFVVNGYKILRAYGTLPHPNILAFYLFAVLSFMVAVWVLRPEYRRWYWYVIYGVMAWALLLTFSRTPIIIWLLEILLLFFWFFVYKKKRLTWLSFILPIIIFGVLALIYGPFLSERFISFNLNEAAVQDRLLFMKVAWSFFMEHPLRGLGIGQFVPYLVTSVRHITFGQFQPVHNIVLLWLSELGAFGFLSVFAFCFLSIRYFWLQSKKMDFLRIFICFQFVALIIIGMTDHYMWTLQQGSLIAAIFLAFLSYKTSS